MKNLHFILIGFLTFGYYTPISAQEKSSNLEALMPLVGQWEGTGWMQTQDGQRLQFKQTEDIYTKLDGQLLVVNGLGRDPETGEKVFEAFGILNYSKEDKAYKFNTYTHRGDHGIADVKLGDGQFDWWFTVPSGGTVKYSITFTDSTWSEDGHYSPDGENWYPFFHMDLKKKI